MATAASYPTDVKTLHFMLDEQRQLIESLKANLRRLLKWEFGPKSEHLNVDQPEALSRISPILLTRIRPD